MEHLSPTQLTTTGRPLLVDGEVEIKIEEYTAVLIQENKRAKDEILPSGTLILTNIRLITVVDEHHEVSRKKSRGWGLLLSSVSLVEDCASFFGSSTRISIFINGVELGLKFPRRRKDAFLPIFHQVLSKKSWESVIKTSATLKQEETVFSVSNAGVSGLLRKQEKTIESAEKLTKEALTDLDALMSRAKEVINVIEKFAASSQEKYGDKPEDISETSSEIAENNALEEIMQSIGMVSPVTKFSAGRQYHKQLARQVADILFYQKRLERLGGMITLPDLYCLVNRARGTELVSPADLLSAAENMAKLRVGMSLRCFPSGVKVVQLDSFNEASLSQRILSLFNSDESLENGIQAADVAQSFNVSILIAKEQLLIAESQKMLCRDLTIRGLFFFPNKFEAFFMQYEK